MMLLKYSLVNATNRRPGAMNEVAKVLMVTYQEEAWVHCVIGV